ncbi:MAG: hypothetical protein ABSA11_15445 [Candidatus Bathyarchaeia archaeon]
MAHKDMGRSGGEVSRYRDRYLSRMGIRKSLGLGASPFYDGGFKASQ